MTRRASRERDSPLWRATAAPPRRGGGYSRRANPPRGGRGGQGGGAGVPNAGGRESGKWRALGYPLSAGASQMSTCR